ncbi:MAG: CRISPR-associated endonuclease Cas1 [Desulfurococcaceae archaeon]
MTILVVEGAAKVCRKEGNIAVSDKEGSSVEVPVPDLELVVIVGERVLVTTSALITLLSNGVPVVFLSGKLDTYGVLYDVVQVGTTNIREVQYKCFSDEFCKMMYAKPIIYSKIRGLYNTLRYEYKYYKDLMSNYEDTKTKMLEVMNSIEKSHDLEELRRLEAVGSKYFWYTAINLLPSEYGFTGREPRKGDVVNSSIDFLYAILYGVVTKAIVTTGLDPFYGVIHVLRSGRLSLTYDLSEIFKPLAVHSIIQASRKARLRTLRGSRMLTPRTIEILVGHLYSRLSRESEKLYNRKSIWILPMREVARFKDSILKRFNYEAYTYDPTSGTSA